MIKCCANCKYFSLNRKDLSKYGVYFQIGNDPKKIANCFVNEKPQFTADLGWCPKFEGVEKEVVSTAITYEVGDDR